MKKVEKEKHFYEEIFKITKKNVIKILISFPYTFFFLVIKVMPFIKNEKI